MYRNMNLPPIEEIFNQLSDAAIEAAQVAILSGQITPAEVPEYTRQWMEFQVKKIMKIYYPYSNFYRPLFPSPAPITRRESKEYSLRKNIEK